MSKVENKKIKEVNITNNENSIKRNMALSGIVKPLSMLINFIYTPIALNYLGVEKYGVWATILSILSWISYFDIGIGNGLRNKLTEKLTENDRESSNTLISTSYIFIAGIMTVVFIIFMIIAKFVNWNAVLGINNINENLMLIVILCVAFVCANFILSICNNVMYAVQKSSLVSLIQLLIQIVNLILVLIFSNFYKENLWLMTFIYGISMISMNLFASIYIYYKYPYLKPNFKNFDFKSGKNVTNLGLQFFIIQICTLILYTTDSIIISSLFGASEVTPYSTVNKLYSAISSFYAALIVPIWSSFTLAKAKGDYIWMKKILKKLNLLMIPFMVAVIILAVVFKDVAFIWLKKSLEYSPGLILLGAVYCILTIWGNTYSMIANGLSLMKISIIASVAQAILNIPISLFFAVNCNMGSAGVLFGTVLSMLIGSVLVPYKVIKVINNK